MSRSRFSSRSPFLRFDPRLNSIFRPFGDYRPTRFTSPLSFLASPSHKVPHLLTTFFETKATPDSDLPNPYPVLPSSSLQAVPLRSSRYTNDDDKEDRALCAGGVTEPHVLLFADVVALLECLNPPAAYLRPRPLRDSLPLVRQLHRQLRQGDGGMDQPQANPDGRRGPCPLH